MNNPNSIVVRIRFWLADKLTVSPPMGEAWCVNCRKNGRKTLVIGMNAMREHIRTHPPDEYVKIVAPDVRRK